MSHIGCALAIAIASIPPLGELAAFQPGSSSTSQATPVVSDSVVSEALLLPPDGSPPSAYPLRYPNVQVGSVGWVAPPHVRIGTWAHARRESSEPVSLESVPSSLREDVHVFGINVLKVHESASAAACGDYGVARLMARKGLANPLNEPGVAPLWLRRSLDSDRDRCLVEMAFLSKDVEMNDLLFTQIGVRAGPIGPASSFIFADIGQHARSQWLPHHHEQPRTAR